MSWSGLVRPLMLRSTLPKALKRMEIAVYLSREAGERTDKDPSLGLNGNNSTTGDDVKRKKEKKGREREIL